MRDDGEQYVPNHYEWGRLFRVTRDFVRGFRVLRKYCLAATFFGTARCGLDAKIYEEARTLAGLLAKDGFTVITGGGPGVMQAANHGAQEAGGNSVGLNIQLPNEQAANPYLTDTATLHYFFTRKVLLAFASEVYIFFPGGFGTLDELFEMLTLIQTKRMQRIPVILVNREYWSPLLKWIDEVVYEREHAIDSTDRTIYTLVDSAEEAHAFIRDHVEKAGLKPC